jgi:hypothetical protein
MKTIAAPDWKPPSSTKEKRPHFHEKPQKSLTEELAELADALMTFINRRNGWTVSVPGSTVLRVELPVSISAQVIGELNKLKFEIKHVGFAEHLWAISGRFVPVEIFEIQVK